MRRAPDQGRQPSVFLAAEERHFAKDGLGPAMDLREDGLRTDMGPGTFEWWYFDAHAGDGTLIIVIFFTKPMIGINGPAAPFVNVRIITPDGRTLRVEASCAAPSFTASRDRCHIAVGNNEAIGGPAGYRLHIDIDGVRCDLSFTPLAPPWRPGTGKIYFGPSGDRYFGWVVAMPSGSVSGSLELDGVRRPITGAGYHDHNWGTIPMTRAWSSWWWSRASVGEYTVLAAELTTTPSFGSDNLYLLMVARGGQLLLDDSSLINLVCTEPVNDHESRKHIPSALIFHYDREGTSISLSLQRQEELFKHSFLRKQPFWKRTAARMAGLDPWYFRFRGTAGLRLVHQGSTFSGKGSTVFERMCFSRRCGEE